MDHSKKEPNLKLNLVLQKLQLSRKTDAVNSKLTHNNRTPKIRLYVYRLFQ